MPGLPGPPRSAGPQQEAAAIAKTLGNTSTTNPNTPANFLGSNLKLTVYWGVASVALIALAAPYPDLATGFVVLLIVGVVLTHYQDYIGLFSPPKK
jgi:hypothetical protein